MDPHSDRHPTLWLWVASAFVAAGLALFSVSENAGYALLALAVVCFVAAARGRTFPLAPKPERGSAGSQLEREPETVVPRLVPKVAEPALTVRVGQYQRNKDDPESVRCEVQINSHRDRNQSFTLKLWQRLAPESTVEGKTLVSGDRWVPLLRDGDEYALSLSRPMQLGAGESRHEWIVWRWPGYGNIGEHVVGGRLGGAGDDLRFSIENHTLRERESEPIGVGSLWPPV